MNELVKALTRAANAVADYYEKQDHAPAPQPELPLDKPAAEPKPPKAKKEKVAAPKEEMAEMVAFTEEQSKERVMTVAKAYVLRFQDAKPTGYDRAVEKLKTQFKVASLIHPETHEHTLNHAQRLQFATALEKEMDTVGAAA